jgi:carboxypeptidase D
MIDQKNETYFNLTGVLAYDPTIGSFLFTNHLAAYPMIKKHDLFFNFNQSFMQTLESAHQKCGYEAYYKKYLTFPPPGVQAPWDPNGTVSLNPDCQVWDMAWLASFVINPCFNEYLITGSCPILFDPLAFPTDLAYAYTGFGGPYFNRTDVKAAMHAPAAVDWAECSGPVFADETGQYGNGDTSKDPIQYVLPKVIEHTNRVLIAEGDFDFSVLTDATLISIQNMTWNGKLGFQKKPAEQIVIDLPDLQWGPVFDANGFSGGDGPGQGVMGVQHYERGK